MDNGSHHANKLVYDDDTKRWYEVDDMNQLLL